MKKYKQYYPVNNQEDEDSSSYPLYPHREFVYKKEKKQQKTDTQSKIDSTERVCVSQERNRM